ncbi:hypothetical protein [Arthrobacter sp. efr-133-TYG-120]|uniref:hypothetical protein n=1 Tax=Arthrobacter sp. efr-133-TYG-120 TaxID=3040280 RepID=UPI00254BB00C|nr:hypothetical protein [Arthrobacter sp. efr-133-TYG-120]
MTELYEEMTETESSVSPLPVQGARPTLDDSLDLRLIIPGAESVEEPIRYGDSAWNFVGYPRVNQTDHWLDFEIVPPRWRGPVKDWALLRLNPKLAESGESGLHVEDVMAQPAAAEKPLKLHSAFAYVLGLAKSLTVIDRYFGDSLGPEDWRAFAQHLAAENPNASPVTLAAYARPLLSIWSYRGLLGVPDMFGGRPLGGHTPDRVFGVPQRDLNVERPAPELCGPVLGLCLWVMDHCAEDILSRLETLASAPDRTGLPREEQIEAVTDLLMEWELTGRPMPGVTSLRGKTVTPAWATFVKLAGCSPEALRNPVGKAKKVLEMLRQKVGASLSEDGFDLPITKVPGPGGRLVPWIDSLAPTRYGPSLDTWTGNLAYCCTVVIVLLTTVRDRELAALPHDCLVDGTYERGDMDVAVTRMRGYLVKNRSAPMPADWIVGDDVIRAVQIIHRLKAALRLQPRIHPQTGQEVLLHPGLGRAQGEQSADTLQLASAYLRKILATGAHLSERGVVVPLPPMPAWLPHRTLRITGIEAYASQAWGDALAAAQAHWSNRTVAEGYLGHLPRSVFIADPQSVEEARQMAVGQALLDVASDAGIDDANVAGNGSGRLDAVLEKANAYELVTGPVTSRQARQIAKTNPNVAVGELTICVFGPGGLCGNESEAEFKLCRPYACRNSATTRAQRARNELRRRGWVGLTGVFERARRKIEADVPGIAKEFADLDDKALRTLIIEDMPGRYQRLAQESADNEE